MLNMSLLLNVFSQAKPRMVKSHVVDNETGKSKDSDIRTSTGTFFAKGEDEIIARIEKRVAQVTMIPLGEQLLQPCAVVLPLSFGILPSQVC
jgi:hypothetical protein